MCQAVSSRDAAVEQDVFGVLSVGRTQKLPQRPRGGTGEASPKAGASEAHAGLVLKYLFIYSAESCFPGLLCSAWTGLGEVGLRAACTEARPLQGPVGVWRDAGEGGSPGACPRVPLGVKGSGLGETCSQEPPALGLRE